MKTYNLDLGSDYCEIINIIAQAQQGYSIPIDCIINALNQYIEWTDRTGEEDLSRVLYHSDGYPVTAMDIREIDTAAAIDDFEYDDD